MPGSSIMIIEDEQIVALDIRGSLENAGYVVVGVTDRGETAIQKLHELRPDLVLMDIGLKGEMDGIETASQIRARFELPVIFLTALSNQPTLERARLAEPFGYIIKPFVERDLLITIEMALYKHSMEKKLRESEIKFRSLIENATDGIGLIDSQGSIIDWNPAIQQITGLNHSDVINQPVWEIISSIMPKENRNVASQELMKHAWKAEIANGFPNPDHMKDYEIEDSHGIRHTVQSNGFALETPQGRLGGVILRDITIQKQTEAREARRRALLEKVIELGKTVTQTTDIQQCLRKIHQSVQQGLGFDRVGLFLYDTEKGEIKGTLGTNNQGEMIDNSQYVASIHEDKAWGEIVTKNGGWRHLDDYQAFYKKPAKPDMQGVSEHIVLSTWAGDIPVGFIAADNLISQRAFTLEEVDALRLFAGYAGLAIKNTLQREAIEQRVVERTVELESANGELEALSYTIGHDLRSPIRAIVAYSHLLLDELSGQLDYSQGSKLQQVNQVAMRMGNMVDEFLTFLRLSRSVVKRSTVDMDALIRRVIKELKPAMADREIEFLIKPIPACNADEQLTQIIYAQLISNSIKFSNSRNPAKIEIGAFENEGKVCYFVRDNGAGFDMQYAGKLFGVFQRLHHYDEYDGTGVGLAITQRIIHRHGGRIWAEADIDKGATFYFTLS